MQSKILNNRPMMDIQDTYTLRGICMLMIIVHHVIKLMPDCPMTIWRWGDLGTAVFFFISGWGLYCSMDKKEKVDWVYLLQNVKKLIIPYFIVWALTELAFKLIHTEYSSTKMICDGLTLSYPSFTVVNLWFFKVILTTYVLSILTFILVKQRVLRLSIIILIILLCIGYIIVAWRVLCLPSYWWCSVFCFPIGMWLSAYRSELQGVLSHKIAIAVIAAAIYVLFVNYDFLPMPRSIKYVPAFCLLTVSLISIVNIQSKLLYFIGKNSLLFYLIHIAALLLLTEILGGIHQYYVLILGVVLVVTSALCWGYTQVENLFKKIA